MDTDHTNKYPTGEQTHDVMFFLYTSSVLQVDEKTVYVPGF